ncbi:MAG: SPW repeat protein [Thiohalomonadales bacterium]
MKNQRGQDWTVFLLGVWLVISPLIGIGVINDVAAINSYIVGSAVILFSIAAITKPRMWEEYINIALGVWLLSSPFIFDYSHLTAPAWNQILVGLLIGGSALAVTLKRSGHTTNHGHT